MTPWALRVRFNDISKIYLHMELLKDNVEEDIGTFSQDIFQLFFYCGHADQTSQTYTQQIVKESCCLAVLINRHSYALTKRSYFLIFRKIFYLIEKS